MKKIYLVLLISLLLGFVAGSKAKGQPGCEDCFAPWSCTTFTTTVNCNGLERDIEVTVCYYCYLTLPRVDVNILSIRGIPGSGDCWQLAREAAQNWILEHGMEFCGTLPCSESRRIFKITFPTCADAYYYYRGNIKVYDVYRNSNCELSCYTEFEWCWCNCTPDCDPNPNCTPHVQWTQIIPYTSEGNGQCEYQQVPPPDKLPALVTCQRFKNPCSE